MKKEYLIIGGLALVGIYFLMRKKESKNTSSKTVDASVKNGDGNAGTGTSFDCSNAKLKYPEKHQEAIREYDFILKVRADKGEMTGVSPMMREQSVCDILRRNIIFPNTIKIGDCKNGPC